MTCADARRLILTADVSALRGESDRALRTHLDGCPACAADASRVLGDTRRLGAALVARARRPEIRRASRRRSAFVVVPIGVAAAIMVIVMAHRSARTTSPRVAIATSPAAPKTSVSDGDTDLVSPAPGGGKQAASRVATASATKARAHRGNQRPEPAISKRESASNVLADLRVPEVSVTVGNNQRAAIISTSNRNITVVWLTRGQQP